MADEKDYISLKRAAEISGYSSDYLGQLIRSGKLDGKQVFSNVSWVTTEEALTQYLSKENKGVIGASRSFSDVVTDPETLSAAYSIVVWIAIGILMVFALLLGYVLAVSIDHSISQKYLEKAEYVR